MKFDDDYIREYIARKTDSGIPGHYCNIGGVPKDYKKWRVCDCGQVYVYGPGAFGFGLVLWRRANWWQKWLLRRKLAVGWPS